MEETNETNKDPNISLLQRKLKELKGCSCTYDEIDKECYWHKK